jgi:hypothetical protein
MDSESKEELSDPKVRWYSGERLIATCGYLLVFASISLFGVIAFIQLRHGQSPSDAKRYESWLDFVQYETPTLTLFLIAVISAILGRQLLTSTRLAYARTIPHEDLPLVKEAVIAGKPEPIDQYVRLRSLSGISGNFTKLGITGLPLTTVLLTLIFSFISIMPVERAAEFLDFAKLTLGAFIGSFVQRQVEQRRHEIEQLSAPAQRSSRTPDLPA